MRSRFPLWDTKMTAVQHAILQPAAQEYCLSKTSQRAVNKKVPSQLSSIRVQDLLVVEQASFTGQEQDRRRHVAVMPSPARRIAHLHVELALVVLAAVTGSHLGWKDAGRDDVHAHLRAGESRRKHAAEMSGACFAGSVGELAVARAFHLSRDGGNVDDLACVTRSDLAALCE